MDDNAAHGVHTRFGFDELLKLLVEVDEIMAAEDATPLHLVVVGGASMLTRVSGRQTGDIDIVSEGVTDQLRNASRTVAATHNLEPNWINDAAKGFAVSVDLAPEQIFAGECLTVASAGPRYLLAMKLLSGRESDEEDCVHLIRETGIYDVEDLLDLMEKAAGVRGVRPRDVYWAMERRAAALRGRRIRSLGRRLSCLVKRMRSPVSSLIASRET